MKLLIVLDNSIGVHYIRACVNYLNDAPDVSAHIIKLSIYPEFDDSGFDGLIYNTFPDERHASKFRKSIIAKTDKKFLAFKGPKLLFDSHDDGSMDAFTRFNMPQHPRIKLSPTYDLLKKLNIPIIVPFYTGQEFFETLSPRTIPLIYCAKLEGYATDIRRQVYQKLLPFDPFTTRLPYGKYVEAIKHSLVGVVAPGWGAPCIAHGEVLAAGSMLFAHESIRNHKLLPFADLVEDEDYVSYNLENLQNKLQFLFSIPSLIKSIALKGNEAFRNGYDRQRSADAIIQFFGEAL